MENSFRFTKEVNGKWFKINAWGWKTFSIQLDPGEDSVVWLPDDPKQAATLLRQAADILENELAPAIENYKKSV